MHEHLWNNLPDDERKRLMPYELESQITHIKQVRQKVVDGHKRTLREIDDWIKSLEHSLKKRVREQESNINAKD